MGNAYMHTPLFFQGTARKEMIKEKKEAREGPVYPGQSTSQDPRFHFQDPDRRK